jgi:hypothetical protein
MLSIANEYSLSICGMLAYLYIQIIHSICNTQILYFFNNSFENLEGYNLNLFLKHILNLSKDKLSPI